ncbi:hypothetical protein OH492_10235 [Vibrio chagasii]|nr:hypothetical protein [Vibrio chagasii]
MVWRGVDIVWFRSGKHEKSFTYLSIIPGDLTQLLSVDNGAEDKRQAFNMRPWLLRCCVMKNKTHHACMPCLWLYKS